MSELNGIISNVEDYANKIKKIKEFLNSFKKNEIETIQGYDIYVFINSLKGYWKMNMEGFTIHINIKKQQCPHCHFLLTNNFKINTASYIQLFIYLHRISNKFKCKLENNK
jgi:hypothetical protein